MRILWFTDIQQLMACLLYTKTGLDNSPYAYLLDPVHWIDICDLFARDACALLGLSLESPLQVCITAGCIALPSLLQIKQVIQQKQVPGVWSSKDELPVSLDLQKTIYITYIYRQIYHMWIKPGGKICILPSGWSWSWPWISISLHLCLSYTKTTMLWHKPTSTPDVWSCDLTRCAL